MIIRGYIPSEAKAVRDLITRAFGQPDEADLVEALRDSGDMALELVAEDRKRIVGHVALSRMESPKGWLALAPVCADPKRQNKGIGSVLCHMALQYANAPVVVLGEPSYYIRFGFDFDRGNQMTSAFPTEFTGVYLPDDTEGEGPFDLVYAKPFLA